MNVFITFDYELFFGSESGSVQKCIIDPTEKLIEISRNHKVNFTFFVDAGYLVHLKLNSKKFPELQKDYDLVCNNIKLLENEGHSIQLHIHPHWEKSYYDGTKWVFNIDGCYALADFSNDMIEEIVTKYKQELQLIIQHPISSFRAGGLAVQPFDVIRDALLKNNVYIDSSVLNLCYKKTEAYGFDYRSSPNKGRYSFEKDVCKEEKGSFLELPIAGWKYSRFFYWKLYLLGYFFPSKHKFIGDGNYVPTPNERRTKLFNSRFDNVSCDGYYSSSLKKIFKRYKDENRSDIVVLGHPKSQTKFSLKKLDKTIATTKNKYQYKTF